MSCSPPPLPWDRCCVAGKEKKASLSPLRIGTQLVFYLYIYMHKGKDSCFPIVAKGPCKTQAYTTRALCCVQGGWDDMSASTISSILLSVQVC